MGVLYFYLLDLSNPDREEPATFQIRFKPLCISEGPIREAEPLGVT